MAIRMKFKVTHKQIMSDLENHPRTGGIIELRAVVNGDPENQAFFGETPAGHIRMIVRSDAFNAFEEGDEYYVEFTPAK